MKENRTASIPGYYVEFQANVLRQLPRLGQIDQITIEGWNRNQKALKEALARVLLPEEVTVTDDRFKLLNSFEFMVSENYVHETQIASFNKKNRKDFYYYNDNITDKNFARVGTKLVPGRTYTVKIFQILKSVSSEKILEFLDAQEGNCFVGAQGLAALWEDNKEIFPIGKWTIAIDRKDNLWIDAGGNRGVPDVNRYSGGDWDFRLDRFDGDWDTGDCVLCVCDLE